MRLDNQIVGNAGLYYVCYRLSLLGWNVMPTARNARGIDVVAYSGDVKCAPRARSPGVLRVEMDTRRGSAEARTPGQGLFLGTSSPPRGP